MSQQTDAALDRLLEMAVEAGAHALLAPKVIDGSYIDRLDDAMSRAGAPT